MKSIYLFYRAIDMEKPTGIDKKVLTQLKVFNENGLNCELIVLKNGVRDESVRSLSEKIKYRLPGSNMNPKWEYLPEYDGNDLVYFRRPMCVTKHMVDVLAEIKERNPNTKIVMEIPTYPYDKELTMSKKDYPIYIKDKYNRKKLHKVIDRIALISGDKEKTVFGIPTVALYNGIDLDLVQPRKPEKDDTIDLCAIAMFAKWHGYDRVIEGMKTYYDNGGQRKLKLHLIGAGAELEVYKKLVADYSLEEHVLFHGLQSGEELEKLYDRMDLGLDVFGMYRKNLNIAYSLKSREYIAKGLPIVSACPTDIFEKHKDFEYYLELENNATPIEIQKIIDFHDEVYKDKTQEEIVTEIRNFAVKTVDISDSMKDIMDYILS